jgi:phospholipid/cholesterol/gamma-HCH transport system ATP-binding protein
VIELEAVEVCLGGRRVLGPISGVFGARNLAVVGPARSGKTTLFRVMTGLLRPSAGRVRIDGEDLARLDAAGLRRVRRHLGLVFQSDALFDSLNVLGNVTLPLLGRGVPEREAQTRAMRMLAEVGLDGQARALPEGLSGGMKKRLGLARAIVAKPRYLLADDPLAGLDPGTSARILDLLFGLWSDASGGLLIAAADGEPIQGRCDQLLLLDAGRVVSDAAEGDHLPKPSSRDRAAS